MSIIYFDSMKRINKKISKFELDLSRKYFSRGFQFLDTL